MACPILAFTSFCGKKESLTENRQALLGLGSIGTDCILFITSLVLGILGILGIVAMPPAAAYSLVGFSGVILLLWCTVIIMAACSEKSEEK
jgi:uncharacterized membrane protein YuzA (DUF378 family)